MKSVTHQKNSVTKKALDLKSVAAISEPQTKAQIIDHLAEQTGIGKKEVQALFAAIYELIQAHLTPKGSGQVVLPEIGIKIKRHVRPAMKARQGRNPLTGESIMIKAKPECMLVKVQAMQKLKKILSYEN